MDPFPKLEGPIDLLVRKIIDLEGRAHLLEMALTQTLELVQTLSARLEEKLGPELLNDELKRSFAAIGLSPQEDLEKIDALIKQEKRGPAARLVRELMNVPWDSAHQIVAHWKSYKHEDNVQRIQLARWLKATNPALAPVPRSMP